MVEKPPHQVKGTVHPEVIIPNLGLIKMTPGIVISGHLECSGWWLIGKGRIFSILWCENDIYHIFIVFGQHKCFAEITLKRI